MHISRFCLLFSCCAIAYAGSLHSNNKPAIHTPLPPPQTQPTESWQIELKSLNQQILDLSKELTALRRQALNAEMTAQPQMIDSWHEFAKNIGRSEENEKQISALQQQIRALNLRKQAIIRAHLK